MEIEFHQAQPQRVFYQADGTTCISANVVLKLAINPSDSYIYLYHYFERMINISTKGIAVTD